MNDLPDTPRQMQPATPVVTPATGVTDNTGDTPVQPVTSGTGPGGKETEPVPVSSFPEQTGIVETHKDIELPQEVVKAGVTVQPTQITIPPQVAGAGVQPAGDNVTLGGGQTVSLPLTNDQMTVALKKSVADSVRWLAEWCIREIRKMHASVSVKTKH